MTDAVIVKTDRIVIEVSGPDATEFLKNLFTSDPSTGTEGVWFALLSPQGKILAEGLTGLQEGSYFLDVAATVADSFFKRMRMYKLRANVELALRDDLVCGFSSAQMALENAIVHSDARGGVTASRIISAAKDVSKWNNDATGFARLQINRGILTLGLDYESDGQFPHDVGMDMNGGVDFKKGCYVGQEVVSRMQHRATARKRPVVVSGSKHSEICDVQIEDRLIGKAGPAVDGVCLAILRIDKIEIDQSAMIDETPVSLAVPEWARYGFADSQIEQ